MGLDINHLRRLASERDRYQHQLSRLKKDGKQSSCIEAAVISASNTIAAGTKSFVIYGEPQSGKTEMMICLTAKLLDDGHRIVIHLLNDSVQLLQQNLERFQRSNLSPSAKNFSDVIDPDYSLKTGYHVIFCKKNASDLARLNQKTDRIANKVIIDDEADFATPNALINKGDFTKINALIHKLIAGDGIYIGVTATPARLDLNNTFDNDNERWVNFPPHEAYTGQDVFFPIEGDVNYSLRLLPDSDDSPKYLREAIFRFLVRVAALNLASGRDQNFSMLIHTSGKKLDHKSDKKPIDDVMNALSDVHSKKFEDYAHQIGQIASSLYGERQAERILGYIVRNCDQTTTIIMNSERDKNVDFKSATSPAAMFTFIIGGNIVSRGVTFDNLLSMFFTRDSKHKIQQDTYIQRARMFGSRRTHLEHFELTIPKQLYLDWHRCFVFHKLALEAIKTKKGSPVWLADHRIAAVASSSIDKTNVILDRGEMAFPIFDYTSDVELIMKTNNPLEGLRLLQDRIGSDSLPSYLIQYVKRFMPRGLASIALHPSSTIENMKDADKEKIERRKGLFGQVSRDYPDAVHHFKVFHNAVHKARLIYKFSGNITFIKNVRNA
ncbi:DEAD/DEAH box helicase family protein [Bradyrhizobium sp. 83012]|uniref:DEAD/DEAH box helicase family protein n=1 Tax=Bradyrhizobium aeschynomenes TaxID=2734909 RepID=A0ABX2CK26_9BRAD|nr:Z1 domain-containing protein [Bradyrhizobium aeschynomenes]NPU68531.1 DEAD/DEAH box helicase family protein [Bradyrhizobium aeschynomenes]